MNKLISLLKEYIDTHWTDTKELDKEYWIIDTWEWFLYWTREYSYLLVISRKFGFIKWLDKNKKIRWNTPLMTAIKDSFKPLFKEWRMWWRKGELIILMVLATSKKPLYDLYHYMLK